MAYQSSAALICARIAAYLTGTDRILVAISGPPASGKSTLAAEVVEQLNKAEGAKEHAAVVPMDGFHLNNNVLKKRDLIDKKGAVDTFDADGFCALVKRLKNRTESIVYPVFDRSIDMAIAGAGVIVPETEIVILEGNYLLMKTAPWSSVYPIYDITVSLAPSVDVLEERLINRWIELGINKEKALEKVSTNDLQNVKTVLSLSIPAQLALTQ